MKPKQKFRAKKEDGLTDRQTDRHDDFVSKGTAKTLKGSRRDLNYVEIPIILLFIVVDSIEGAFEPYHSNQVEDYFSALH